jgi:hypothetical protein
MPGVGHHRVVSCDEMRSALSSDLLTMPPGGS